MKRIYRNNDGKYQEGYNVLMVLLGENPDVNEGKLLFFKYALELYNEYYNNLNENITGIDEEDNVVCIKAEWNSKFQYIIDNVYNTRGTIYAIMDKIFDMELSVDMEILYEKMMDYVIEYLIDEMHLNVKDRFITEIEFYMGK